MNYDHIFDSSKSVYEKEFEIDYKNDKPLTVLFEKESIVLTVNTHGDALFLNINGVELKKDKAESNRLFSSIYCSANKNAITVRFPVKETIDHYPNCDGEYDRYSERIVDNILITYTL